MRSGWRPPKIIFFHLPRPVSKKHPLSRGALKAFFANPERIAGYIRKANQAVAEKGQLLETHKSEIAKLKEQMARTPPLYLDQAIDSAGFKDLYTSQQERVRQL